MNTEQLTSDPEKHVISAGKRGKEPKVEPLPFMRHHNWKPRHVREACETLAAIPQAEYIALNTFMERHCRVSLGIPISGIAGVAILKTSAGIPLNNASTSVPSPKARTCVKRLWPTP